MAELLRNPRFMKKVQTEVREVLKGTPEITNDDLEKMVYLKTMIKETLRFHPPIPLLVAREARENVKLMGYEIDARTTVITNAWAIGRRSLPTPLAMEVGKSERAKQSERNTCWRVRERARQRAGHELEIEREEDTAQQRAGHEREEDTA